MSKTVVETETVYSRRKTLYGRWASSKERSKPQKPLPKPCDLLYSHLHKLHFFCACFTYGHFFCACSVLFHIASEGGRHSLFLCNGFCLSKTHLFLCAPVCGCPWRPEERLRSPGARVTGSWELLEVGTGN